MTTSKSIAKTQLRTKEPVRLGIPPDVRLATTKSAKGEDRRRARDDEPRRIKMRSKAKAASERNSK